VLVLVPPQGRDHMRGMEAVNVIVWRLQCGLLPICPSMPPVLRRGSLPSRALQAPRCIGPQCWALSSRPTLSSLSSWHTLTKSFGFLSFCVSK